MTIQWTAESLTPLYASCNVKSYYFDVALHENLLHFQGFPVLTNVRTKAYENSDFFQEFKC